MRRLPERDKVVAPPAPGSPPRPPPRRAGQARARFEIRHAGERIEGIAPGVDRRHLRQLRRGQVLAEREVDLHGLRAGEAAVTVRAALAGALAAGERCVRIVHGRGLHSREGPILKQQLVHWLAEPPHGDRVLAFASTREGGATYVLLRRERG